MTKNPPIVSTTNTKSISRSEIFVKEIDSWEQLKSCFKLRYKEYNRINLNKFVVENEAELDINNYDLFAQHWILSNAQNEILGYGRLIDGKRTQFYDQIIQLAGQHKLQHVDPQFQFVNYTCAYGQIPTKLKEQINAIEANYTIIETSRLIIIEKDNSLRNAIFMIESAIAWSLEQSDIVISSCLANQEKLYLRYGYEYLQEGKNYQVEGSQFSSMFIKKEMVVKRFKEKFETRGQQAKMNSLQYNQSV